MVLIGLLLIAGLSFGFALVFSGRTIEVPEWGRARIAATLERQAPQLDIQFGGISLVFEDGFQPRVHIQNVTVEDRSTGLSLDLAEIDTTLSLADLVTGTVAPRTLILAGVTLNLRRLQDGSFNLSLGEGAGVFERGGHLTDVSAIVETLLSLPEFANVERIEAHGVALQFDDARAGRVWKIDGAEARLKRHENGARIAASASLLGARDYASSVEMSLDTAFGSKAAEFGFTFADVPSRDIATQSPALAWLEVLRAPISGALRFSLDDAGALGPMNATLQIGEGVLRPNENVRPVPFRSARSYLTYDPQGSIVEFQDLSVDSAWARATAQGRLILQPDPDAPSGFGDEMLGQFTVTHITANPLNLYDTALTLEEAYADVRMRLDPFEITLGQGVVRDRGHLLKLDGQLTASQEDWELKLNGKMDALTPEWLLSVWPERAKPKSRKWVAKNVLGGSAENLNAVLRLRPGERPDLYYDFRFKDGIINFARGMPAAEGGVGYGVLMNNRFTLAVEEGSVLADDGGRVDATGTVFEVLNTRIKVNPPARVGLKAQGSITAGLSLLDRKPLELLAKNNLPVTLAEGQVVAEGELRFNAKEKLKPEELKFDVSAHLTSVHSDHFLKEQSVSASALDVRATNDGIEIGGHGRVGPLPFDAAWTAQTGPDYEGKSTISGTVSFSAENLAEFGIVLPPRWVTGASQGQMELQFDRGNPATFRLTSTLAGMDIKIPPLGWRKSPDEAVALEMTGTLGEPIKIDSVTVKGKRLTAAGMVTLDLQGGLKVARFDTFKIGDWLDAKGELRGRGNGAAPQLVVQGGRVDMRKLTTLSGPSGTGGATGGPIKARLDHVQISDGISLRGFSGEFTNGGKNGLFVASVNGVAPIRGAMTPVNGRSGFRIQADDAGAVFAAAGLLKTAHDGLLDLTLTPHGLGSYDGELSVLNTRVTNAPAIAELINAISVVGLIEQINGAGINFAEVYARFRLTPDELIIAESSAVGASMGLSMDGHYFPATGKLDMQGVLSPVYVLNALGRVVAKRGEGLFGFNYNIRGSTKDPQVSVNPLSVLTPGFFREIFRRPAPTLDE